MEGSGPYNSSFTAFIYDKFPWVEIDSVKE